MKYIINKSATSSYVWCLVLYVMYCLMKHAACSFLYITFISYRENTKQNNAGQLMKEDHHEKGYI
jgi:hypothetical protein